LATEPALVREGRLAALSPRLSPCSPACVHRPPALPGMPPG